jgi:hypothetical protein
LEQQRQQQLKQEIKQQQVAVALVVIVDQKQILQTLQIQMRLL